MHITHSPQPLLMLRPLQMSSSVHEFLLHTIESSPLFSLSVHASATIMGSDFDTRSMFDRYLYDYLIKHNMHNTAEIFRREAALPFGPTQPAAIDVPEGFLLEWWLMFYDMYRQRQLNTTTSLNSLEGEPAAASIMMPMNANRQTCAYFSRPFMTHGGDMIRDSAITADSDFMLRDFSMPSEIWPLMDDQVLQNFQFSVHQQNPTTALIPELCPSISFANSSLHVIGDSIHAASGLTNFASNNDLFSRGANDDVPPELGNYVLNSFGQSNEAKLKGKMLLAEHTDQKKKKRSSSGSCNGSSRVLVFSSEEDCVTNGKPHELNVKQSNSLIDEAAGVSSGSGSLYGHSTVSNDSKVLDDVKEGGNRKLSGKRCRP